MQVKLSEVEVRAVVNVVFAWIESKESGWLLLLTRKIHAEVDAAVPLIVQQANDRLGGAPASVNVAPPAPE